MAENKKVTPSKKPMGGGPRGMMKAGEKAKDFKKSMKKLLVFIKPYTLPIIISLILAATATVFVVLSPKYLGNITTEIQQAIMGHRSIDMGVIARIGIMLIIFYAVHFICESIQGLLMAGVTSKITKRMRKDISEKINRLPLKYFDKQSVGDVLSRVTNDVDTIAQTLNQSLSSIISSITKLIGFLIAMFTISAKLSAMTLLVFPISIVLMLIIVKSSQKHFKTQQETLGSINGYIEEIYSNHNVVKAFNGEEKSIKEFGVQNNKLFNSAWKSQFLSGMMHPLMTFISNLGTVVVCVMGGLYALNGTISLGDLQSMNMYVRRLNEPIGQVASITGTLQSTAAAAERVFEFLDSPEQEDESHKTVELTKVRGDVEFVDVRFGYSKKKEIIHGFSCDVKHGQKIAIVGPTGSGKTTLVNLLMRFYDANSGDIKIDGQSIYDMKRENVRKLFGMVLQDTWLFEGTVRANLLYGKEDVSDKMMIECAKSANIHHFIETLPNGYDNMLDNSETLSGGQKQLLTIARAMIQNAPMLILDEATSSVDTRTEELIQEAMDKLTKGRTSFIIAHRLSTIKNADMILVLKDGDIIEKGTHQELLEKGEFYADLYNSQFSNKYHLNF